MWISFTLTLAILSRDCLQEVTETGDFCCQSIKSIIFNSVFLTMRSGTLISTTAKGNGKSFQAKIARIRYTNLRLCCDCLYLLFATSCVACSQTLNFLLRDRRIVQKSKKRLCDRLPVVLLATRGIPDRCSCQATNARPAANVSLFHVTSLVLFFLSTQISVIKAFHNQKLLKYLEASGSFFQYEFHSLTSL